MQFPLSLSDIGLCLAIMAILLLVTSELIYANAGRYNFTLDKSRLRLAAVLLGASFAVTVVLRIVAPSLV